jgi:hypothetical protein
VHSHVDLFEVAEKDSKQAPEFKQNSLDELLKKTQSAIESKYISNEKKQMLLNKLNSALDEINTKVNPIKNSKDS